MVHRQPTSIYGQSNGPQQEINLSLISSHLNISDGHKATRIKSDSGRRLYESEPR